MLWDLELVEWWLRNILIKRYSSQIFVCWITRYWILTILRPLWRHRFQALARFWVICAMRWVMWLYFVVFLLYLTTSSSWWLLYCLILICSSLFIFFFKKNKNNKILLGAFMLHCRELSCFMVCFTFQNNNIY